MIKYLHSSTLRFTRSISGFGVPMPYQPWRKKRGYGSLAECSAPAQVNEAE